MFVFLVFSLFANTFSVAEANPYPKPTDDQGVVDNKVDSFGNTFTTLAYANGPGYRNTSYLIANLTDSQVENKTFHQTAGVPLAYETHGGEDVAIYARGPMSHLIHGVHQQNYIAHVMAYASCVGEYKDDNKCAKSYPSGHTPVPSSGSTLKLWLSPFLVALFARFSSGFV